MKTNFGIICGAGILLSAASCFAQTTALPSVVETLRSPGPAPAMIEYQLQQQLLQRIPGLPKAASAQQWSEESARLRAHILNDVAYHGWPREWIDAPPRFEEAGVIESGHGYRIHKLRYEIVPGFMSTALLYEPEKITGRVPAILNFIGHEPEGTAVEYEQKRCINFAKRGIIALNLGWMEFGELTAREDAHDFAAHLDLVGSNALGLFYLAMKRGLDYLSTMPAVDASRIGATGLSGGGWQTVVLSALDPRIAVSVEVAGIGSRESNLMSPKDTYEVEEDAPDLMQDTDYPEFVAMRAPRPTLLIHNAVDSCCFRAPLVKPYIYDAVKPYFALSGAQFNLAWYENFDPGVHNYQRDNRIQAYRFFTSRFHMETAETEIFSDDEIRSPAELAVSLPADNLTVLGLAKQLAAQHHLQPPPGGAEFQSWSNEKRKLLKSVVRYEETGVEHAFRTANARGMGFESISYRFDFSNGLSAFGVLFTPDHAPGNRPVTVVLNDGGYKVAGQQVFDSLARGKAVLALDPLFTGVTTPDASDWSDWAVLVDSSGERCVGMEAAQLLAVVQWLHSQGAPEITLDSKGIRTQVAALVSAALQSQLISSVNVADGMRSFAHLLEKPVPFRAAADLFCLDLYSDFDIETLIALASHSKVSQSQTPE